MDLTFWLWIAFAGIIIGIMALDLGVMHREVRAIGFREAGLLCLFYFTLAMLFFGGVVYFRGLQSGLEYLTGYLVEVSLSFDNLFVFLLVFIHFKVPLHLQHRALFWGIIGAIVARGVLIAAGAALVAQFHWILYFFGAFLVYTGIKMMKGTEDIPDLEQNKIVVFVRKHIRLVHEYHGEHFWVRKDRQLWATPLFLVLVLVNLLDIVFATDSIPAIFAITQDPFVLVTSNVFAILGLRALFFLLAGMAVRFHYLQYGLALVLIVIGGKMLMEDFYRLPIWAALLITVLLIGGSVVASLLLPHRKDEPERMSIDERESA